MGRQDDLNSLMPILTDEIRKRAVRGDHTIYLKSSHIIEDYDEYLKTTNPEFYKKGKIYSKQMCTMALRKLGFSRKATNHHNSVLTLEVNHA
jgi:hypothetical protein